MIKSRRRCGLHQHAQTGSWKFIYSESHFPLSGHGDHVTEAADWRVNPKVFSGSIDARPGPHSGALCMEEPFTCLEWTLVEVIGAMNCKNAENISPIRRFLAAKRIYCVSDSFCTPRWWVADVSAAAPELWQRDSHRAGTLGAGDSATEGYCCSCSIFSENLGDQVHFKYVSHPLLFLIFSLTQLY